MVSERKRELNRERPARDRTNSMPEVENEFASQPDSGSLGGVRREQEYGIAGEEEVEPQELVALENGKVFAEAPYEVAGLSEFAEISHYPVDSDSVERKVPSTNFKATPQALEERITRRLRENANIETDRVVIGVDAAGSVVLVGSVPSQMERIRSEEIASAVPGVKEVVNLIQVSAP